MTNWKSVAITKGVNYGDCGVRNASEEKWSDSKIDTIRFPDRLDVGNKRKG